MFSPVLAANNNHMLRVLPNVYFISSSGREAGSEEGLALLPLIVKQICGAQRVLAVLQHAGTAPPNHSTVGPKNTPSSAPSLTAFGQLPHIRWGSRTLKPQTGLGQKRS